MQKESLNYKGNFARLRGFCEPKAILTFHRKLIQLSHTFFMYDEFHIKNEIIPD